MLRRRWARAGGGSGLARSENLYRSASTRTKTLPQSKAARSCSTMRPRRCSRRNTACKASPVMVLTAWTWMCWAVNQFERCGGARRIGAVAASGAFYRAAAAACAPLFRLLRASGRRRGDKNMRRADFMAKLHARGIGSGVHFPPVHLFKLYRARGFEPGMFPHAERIGASIVTLPLFPAMSEEDVGRVVGAVHQILQRDSKDSQAILV